MKRSEQLSLLTPEQLREYKKFVWRAVGCGIGMLWTFPLFSWPTIYPILCAGVRQFHPLDGRCGCLCEPRKTFSTQGPQH
ncbi:MAG: hypothetical protein RIS80_881 [Actinomycetota bacterium]